MSYFSPERTIVLNQNIVLSDAFDIAVGKAQVVLHPDAQARCEASFRRVERCVSENRHVYGITTGFGPLANRVLGAKNCAQLQQNLIYHLASGVGHLFSWEATRAMILARVMSLLQGASGAHINTIERLLKVLNSGLSPNVPSQGTVGASGDLTPLAHVALALQGKAGFRSRDGNTFSGDEALNLMGLEPLNPAFRDALALVNGTSAMTGLAVLNATHLERAVRWAAALSAGHMECLGGRVEAWHSGFARYRPHPGQIYATELLNDCLKGSERINRIPISSMRHGYDLDISTNPTAGQDAYSLRCVPQVIGAVWDAEIWHRRVVGLELTAVTDNPIFPENCEDLALHGGNFMGCHVALAADAASSAATVLAGLVERQIARLTDENLNNGLPPFLTGARSGLNSGFMGAQVTATSLVAEMRTVGAASVQSIATNANNQDVVSMGTISARNFERNLLMLSHVQAISAMCIAQVIDLERSAKPRARFSDCSEAMYEFVRESSPFLKEDRSLSAEIEALAARMFATELDSL